MSNHGHDHHGHDHHGHSHSHSHGHAPAKSSGLHKNWKVWVVIGLMLLGMLIYIFTLDESIQPG